MTEQQRYQATYNALLTDKRLIYVGLLLERAARLWPEQTAVICEDKKVTYLELFQRALRVSAALLKAGITPEQRVMLLYENSINFYVAYYAVWQIGAVIVPVNTQLHPRELALIAAHASPHALIVSTQLNEKVTLFEHTIPVILTESNLTTIQHVAEVPDISLSSRDSDSLAAILYTSGTTGNPKGVMLSSYSIIINCLQAGARFTVKRTDRLLAALPLFHSYTQNTCIWFCAVFGLTAIVVPKIDRKALMQALAYRPTVILGIPQLYGLFTLMRTIRFKNVRYFISGGDLLADKIRMNFELMYGRKICNGYGLTETAPFISVELDDRIRQPDTVGEPFIGIECQIRGDNGALLGYGKTGVLWVKGDNNMLGYFNAPDMTRTMLVDGWLNTGDLALITHKGKIILSGREKDLIKNRGIKIYPQEIENVLMTHPQVLAAAVIGHMRQTEEVPIAYIAARKPIEGLELALRDLCAEHLATYEIPRIFIIRDSLPVTATGKVDKKILKQEQHNDDT